jgi:hypothetical protein
MLLSRDYTFLRTAILTEDVIGKLRRRYWRLVNKGESSTLGNIKEINLRFFKEIPGKEDLATEWVLSSVEKGDGSYKNLPSFIEAATFFFTHYKEQLFKNIVNEYNEESGLTFNPKNILDFNLSALNDIKELYENEIAAKTINILPSNLPEGSQLIYDDGNYQIVEAIKADAVCALGIGTKWCTKEENHARLYLTNGPLFIFYRGKKKWLQMAMGKSSEGAGSIAVNDIKNKEFIIDDELRNVLIKSGFMDTILNKIIKSWDKESEFLRWVGTSPNPYIRQRCAENPVLAILYAKLVIKGRFPEAEPLLIGSREEYDYMMVLKALDQNMYREYGEFSDSHFGSGGRIK